MAIDTKAIRARYTPDDLPNSQYTEGGDLDVVDLCDALDAQTAELEALWAKVDAARLARQARQAHHTDKAHLWDAEETAIDALLAAKRDTPGETPR